ncbi:rRNA pseudouridine synthase [Acetobacteraceae bacterium]|nr:rRNA pseudouridine synthase [Acetobacteraceae bacterium]
MRQNSKQTSPVSESSQKHSASAPVAPSDNRSGERIAKYLARCGIASRRESEKLVEKGRISVYFAESRKKEKITHPSTLIAKTDQVFMDDLPIDPPAMPRLWLYHKPSGLITTHSDPLGRPTIFENLPKELPRVISVGRLDLNSEGLLLLTNDGNLSRELELPDRGWKRIYRVRVFGTINKEALEDLKNGIVVEGVQYKSILVKPEGPLNSGRNTWLTVQLQEGKNREIRRVMQALGLKVNRLIRMAYGPFTLGNLPTGMVQPLTPEEAHHALPSYFPAPNGKTVSAISVPMKQEEAKNIRGKTAHKKENFTKAFHVPDKKNSQKPGKAKFGTVKYDKKEGFTSAKTFTPQKSQKRIKRNFKK